MDIIIRNWRHLADSTAGGGVGVGWVVAEGKNRPWVLGTLIYEGVRL